MTDFTQAMDKLMANASDVIESVLTDNSNFTFEDFLYTLIRDNQKAYIELLYLCRDHQHPFKSAHQQIGKRLIKVLGDDYERTTEGTTLDIFHNTTRNYVYTKK